MLHIILLILKIIGLLLLAVLGLLLLILLVVMLVPIRYNIYAEHGNEFWLDGRASWLLHLIGARFSHTDGVLHIRVKLLWFTLYDNRNPRPPKPREESEDIPDWKKKKLQKKEERKKAVQKILNQRKKQKERKASDRKAGKSSLPGEHINTNTEHKDEVSLTYAEKTKKPDAPITGPPVSEVRTERTKEPEITKNAAEVRKAERKAGEDTEQARADEKISIFQKLLNKIKEIGDRVKTFFTGIKNKIISMFQAAENIKSKIDLITDFLKDKLNHEGFLATYTSVRRILKHLKPRKLKSVITIGTGDPCSTGQVLGLIAVLFSYYGEMIQIVPDFENKVFEGKHYARGRIRLVTVLIIVIKLILDKRFSLLRKNFQILKEAL